jgi:hypothetical protein
MAYSEHATMDGVTVGTTELSLISGTTTLQTDTTDGLYVVVLDANAMANGDIFLLQWYEKAISTGTKRVVGDPVYITHAQGSAPNLVFYAPVPLLHGWDVTLKKISGTDRAFSASIRKVA